MLQSIACSAQKHNSDTSSNGRKSTTSSSLFLVAAVHRNARRADGRFAHSWPLANAQQDFHYHQDHHTRDNLVLLFGVLNDGDSVYMLTFMNKRAFTHWACGPGGRQSKYAGRSRC